MSAMSAVHARDLDLNLLRVIVAVADTGSVTKAAAKLYLTQSAVSAALTRLAEALDAPMLVRHGRGAILTPRAVRLVTEVRPLLRTVVESLATRRIDLAAAVVLGKVPGGIQRTPLFRGHFVCLFDPRHARLGTRPSKRTYLAQDHVIVSYNADLRGTVEDSMGVERKVRCSVGSFSAMASIVDGSELVATLPDVFANAIRQKRPHLRTARFPFPHPVGGMDLFWPTSLEDDEASAFVRGALLEIARTWS